MEEKMWAYINSLWENERQPWREAKLPGCSDSFRRTRVVSAPQAIPASLVDATAPSESSSSCKTSFWNTRLPWTLRTCCWLFIYGLTNGLMRSAVRKMGSLSLHSGPVSFNYKCSLCSRNIFHCLLRIRSEFPTGIRDEIPTFGRGKYFFLLFN